MAQEKQLWGWGGELEGASLVGLTGCFSDILIHSLPPSLCHSRVTEELENEFQEEHGLVTPNFAPDLQCVFPVD